MSTLAGEILQKFMITIITGAPGAGKSSIEAYFIDRTYREQGRELFESCTQRIIELNKHRLHPLSLPDRPPIFSDFKVRFKVGYDKYFEPYYINGFFFGLANDRMDTQFLPPGAKIFFDEGQRYYNSRKSANFPDHVSRAVEIHRHYDIDMYITVQRVMLIDSNVRSLCRRFIEVQEMINRKNDVGDVIFTMWRCREFYNWQDYEEYLEHGAATYTETTYSYEGNIFECYDSFAFADSFLPPDDKDFNYLEFKDRKEIERLPEEIRQFYMPGEPDGYRRISQQKKQ